MMTCSCAKTWSNNFTYRGTATHLRYSVPCPASVSHPVPCPRAGCEKAMACDRTL